MAYKVMNESMNSKVIQARNEGYMIKDIADIFEISVESVRKCLRGAGISANDIPTIYMDSQNCKISVYSHNEYFEYSVSNRGCVIDGDKIPRNKYNPIDSDFLSWHNWFICQYGSNEERIGIISKGKCLVAPLNFNQEKITCSSDGYWRSKYNIPPHCKIKIFKGEDFIIYRNKTDYIYNDCKLSDIFNAKKIYKQLVRLKVNNGLGGNYGNSAEISLYYIRGKMGQQVSAILDDIEKDDSRIENIILRYLLYGYPLEVIAWYARYSFKN